MNSLLFSIGYVSNEYLRHIVEILTFLKSISDVISNINFLSIFNRMLLITLVFKYKLDILVYACNPSTLEMKRGGTEVQGDPTILSLSLVCPKTSK